WRPWRRSTTWSAVRPRCAEAHRLLPRRERGLAGPFFLPSKSENSSSFKEPPMRQPNVTVYGSRTCPDTQRATRYLDANQVAYEFKDVDETPELNEYVASLNSGKRVIPAI